MLKGGGRGELDALDCLAEQLNGGYFEAVVETVEVHVVERAFTFLVMLRQFDAVQKRGDVPIVVFCDDAADCDIFSEVFHLIVDGGACADEGEGTVYRMVANVRLENSVCSCMDADLQVEKVFHVVFACSDEAEL